MNAETKMSSQTTFLGEWKRLLHERLGLEAKHADQGKDDVVSRIKSIPQRQLRATFRVEAGKSAAEENVEAAQARCELDVFERTLKREIKKQNMVAFASSKKPPEGEGEYKHGRDEEAKEKSAAGKYKQPQFFQTLPEDNQDHGDAFGWSRFVITMQT